MDPVVRFITHSFAQGLAEKAEFLVNPKEGTPAAILEEMQSVLNAQQGTAGLMIFNLNSMMISQFRRETCL
jgi:hypothetical protein